MDREDRGADERARGEFMREQKIVAYSSAFLEAADESSDALEHPYERLVFIFFDTASPRDFRKNQLAIYNFYDARDRAARSANRTELVGSDKVVHLASDWFYLT